ncbi:peptide MFS transporter [Caulobacter vibrioides]|uniref:Peptide transporter n=2 Tax=Caulobacter vibrioides TaxID=155892 RepID=Q9A2Z3_CAUVC|nr:peptide MFS transporter [Caulobacter vibrioides]YP_002518897.1 di-/tripeptide transporter [Caulobacter vibrioides NA1000]AAK25375.1 peptide transporter [Caulobacter vibrioides CB15]ACL96989.1 di-/tripeptide transporter [Caulobacter vibrioides NA1000]ATC30234.1 peptide MFS transporter [Caulobacter vibrioides]QXZ51760.1 peptide MFS transporter [Caulobacter vibrioides]
MNIVIAVGILVTLVTGIPVLLQLLKGHPRGLIICFLAEMWERFSYYGMRAILIFYLTQHFLFDPKAASGHYGSYTALVYLVPLIGGFLADKWLGTRKAVAFGAVLLVAGHLAMAIEGKPAVQTLTYQGATYEFQAEGRGQNREAKLVVDGKAYEVAATKVGDFEIKGLPANAPLPAVLPKADYKLDVAGRDPLYLNIFWFSLSLIILGVGFLKPNISTIVGQLYPQGDPRRDPGFTLYYYGINLGSFWASILCGLLGVNVGWWAGFGLAGVGMLAGFIVFVLGKPWLDGKAEPPEPKVLKEKVAGPINRELAIYGLSLVGLVGIFFLVQFNAIVGVALNIGILASLGYIGFFMFTKCAKEERERLALAVFLIFGAVVFWTLFEQAGSSLSLFAATNVQLDLVREPLRLFSGAVTLATPDQLAKAGIDAASTFWVDTSFNAPQTQALNAGWILIFAPVFAAVWTFLGARGKDPNPVIKFGLALIQVGAGFLLLQWGSTFADGAFKLPLIFLVLMYMLHTTGELCMSPVGLSQMTKLSPASVVSFMMAVWFLAVAIAQWVGGKIAGLAATETVGGQVLDPGAALAASLKVFNIIGLVAVAIGIGFLLLSPVLKKWSHGADNVGAPKKA